MSYEMIVGLQVHNEETYRAYRAAMAPFLAEYQGGFRYDFKVSEVLKSPVDSPINRLFAIYFEDQGKMERFFADPGYLKVKKEYFEASVSSTVILSQYEQEG